MPRKHVPGTLYKKAIKVLSELVYKGSLEIEEQYGSYNNIEARYQVNLVSGYMMCNLKSQVVDDLCAARKDLGIEESMIWDVRIFLDILLYPRLKNFSTMSDSEEQKLPVWDPFWENQLSMLPRLITLDISGVATNKSIAIVARTCKDLKELTLSPVCKPTYSIDTSCYCSSIITPKGILELTKCVHLEKLIIRKCYQWGDCPVFTEDETIIALLNSLKNLITLPNGKLNAAIYTLRDSIKKPLKLTEMWDHVIDPLQVKVLETHCPNITRMTLCKEADIDQEDICNEYLTKLKDIFLPNLNSIKIINFPFHVGILNFFEGYGQQLRTLTLSPGHPIDSMTIMAIAKVCPNLETFEIENLGSEDERYQQRHRSKFRNNKMYFREPMFTEMKHLVLNGFDWDPYVVLPIVLTFANELETMKLISRCSEDLMIGKTLERIIESNPLSKLKSARFVNGFLLSRENVDYILHNCEDLQEFYFCTHPGLDVLEATIIKDEMDRQNIDVKLVFKQTHLTGDHDEWLTDIN